MPAPPAWACGHGGICVPQRRSLRAPAACRWPLAAAAAAASADVAAVAAPASAGAHLPGARPEAGVSSRGLIPAAGVDYASLLQRGRDGSGCPFLLLAPMEVLADRPLRRAMAHALPGGFDEACQEFIRVPDRVPARDRAAIAAGLARKCDGRELSGLGCGGSGRGAGGGSEPRLSIDSCGDDGGGDAAFFTPSLAAQIMGSDPALLALVTRALIERRGAPRVDLNAGCPANCVTSKGAGSGLLRDPQGLHDAVAAMARAPPPAAIVTVKMRSGLDDTGLFVDNLLAAQAAGAAFITIHPRTRRQKYAGAADWGLIRLAVETLRVPVIGNGDIVSVADARRMMEQTGCSGLMIGRGAIMDPLLFRRIRRSFGPGGGLEAPAARRGGPGPGPRAGVVLLVPTARQHGAVPLISEPTPAGSGGIVEGPSGSGEARLISAFLRAYAAELDSLGPGGAADGEAEGGREADGAEPNAHAAAGEAHGAAAGPVAAAAAADPPAPVGVAAPGPRRASRARSDRAKSDKLKQVLRYLFAGAAPLREALPALLRAGAAADSEPRLDHPAAADAGETDKSSQMRADGSGAAAGDGHDGTAGVAGPLLRRALAAVANGWGEGPRDGRLPNHMSGGELPPQCGD